MDARRARGEATGGSTASSSSSSEPQPDAPAGDGQSTTESEAMPRLRDAGPFDVLP